MAWRDLRLLQRLKLRVPLFQSPMAGVQTSDLAIAVARGGGLGAIPCALLSPDSVRKHVQFFRNATTDISTPINLNFFCHTTPPGNVKVQQQWQDILEPYYREYNVDVTHLKRTKKAVRMPFDGKSLELVQELKPEVVSFHFGLPSPRLLKEVKTTGAFIISSATTVREALWLEERGCDAVVAQGIEAGGHRAVFLHKDKDTTVSDHLQYRNSFMDFPRQTGVMSLVPQIVNAVNIPVIAAGGIGNACGIFAVCALGAAAVQLGTVFLLADEVTTSSLHREILKRAARGTNEEIVETAITNIFTGRPARGFVTRIMRELGPMCAAVPEFPFAGTFLEILKLIAEARGDTTFSSLWSGQSPKYASEQSAEVIVRSMNQELGYLVKERQKVSS